jgi:hypothetical protein
VDGFDVLALMDTNADGKINASDAKFSELRIWQDLNGNGAVDAGEMHTLVEMGITSISLARSKSTLTINGNTIGYESLVTFADGSTTTAGTAYMKTDGQNTLRPDNTPTFTMGTDVDKLPQLPGSGLINSIAYKASTDAGFKAAWTALTDNAGNLKPEDLRGQFEALLLKWAGADGVADGSRGGFVDAHHLAFIEKFFGDTYKEAGEMHVVATSPTTAAFGLAIEASFAHLVDVMETMFLAQVAKSDLARGASIVDAVNNPYFFYSLLDFRSNVAPADHPSPTPGNLGLVLDLIKATAPISANDNFANMNLNRKEA